MLERRTDHSVLRRLTGPERPPPQRLYQYGAVAGLALKGLEGTGKSALGVSHASDYARREANQAALELAGLTPLMKITGGSPDIAVGLIDGPVELRHPGLAGQEIRELPGEYSAQCQRTESTACLHGTFVAGILSGRRDSIAPAICPQCTLLLRVIFAEFSGAEPTATPEELGAALIEAVKAGARIVNISAALTNFALPTDEVLAKAIDHAAQHGVLVVAAAGNQGAVNGSPITSHPWVIPVVACDGAGRPLDHSNLGLRIGLQGLRAPGEVTSFGASGNSLTLAGTSAATALVTGAASLVWSEFPWLALARSDSRSHNDAFRGERAWCRRS